MVDRHYTDCELISSIVELDKNEIKDIIRLKWSFLNYCDKKIRNNYLNYYIMYKYEDWKKRLFIDFNEHDILEFCGGKSAKLLEWSLCNMQYMHIKMGIDLAHTLALINLYDLNYLREDITEILGNCDVSFDAENLNDADFLQDRVKIHSKNKGIRYKRSEILFNLLCFEKNIDNASKIVGLSENQINKFIERNSMFKSDDEKSFLDKNKLSDILNKWKMEVFVESWILEKIY